MNPQRPGGRSGQPGGAREFHQHQRHSIFPRLGGEEFQSAILPRLLKLNGKQMGWRAGIVEQRVPPVQFGFRPSSTLVRAVRQSEQAGSAVPLSTAVPLRSLGSIQLRLNFLPVNAQLRDRLRGDFARSGRRVLAKLRFGEGVHTFPKHMLGD